MGFDAASAAWHSLGEYGDLACDAPVGTPLMVIFDHFVLGLGCEMGVSEDRWREQEREVLMWGAASWRVCGVAAGPPVMTKLPLAVHLAASSWT